jgi:N-methylhydantoinase A
MGGTSTDVCLIRNGKTEIAARLAGSASASMVDIHTVGAGGGSIARIDHG